MTNSLTENNSGKARKLRRWLPWLIVFVLFVLWWGVPTGRKMYYDGVVRELCAKDGGVKVYETVTLPTERFDKYGSVRIPLKEKMSSTDEYYYESSMHYYHKGHPELWRLHFQIFRRLDNKLLGEATSYARRGGDPISPMHDSSFGCPIQADISDLEKQIFIVKN